MNAKKTKIGVQAGANRSHTYQAYLLRLWRGGKREPWRFSLLPADGEQDPIHLASLPDLLAFLQAQINPNERN